MKKVELSIRIEAIKFDKDGSIEITFFDFDDERSFASLQTSKDSLMDTIRLSVGTGRFINLRAWFVFHDNEDHYLVYDVTDEIERIVNGRLGR